LLDAPKPTLRRSAHVVQKSALFTSLLFSGLFAGFLTGVSVLEFSLRRFQAPVYTQVRQVELAHHQDLATVLLPGAIISTMILLAVTIKRRHPTRWPVLTALIMLAAIVVISLLVNEPINTEQHGWSVLAPPSNWATVRDHWQIAHLVRNILALLSFALLIAVPVTRRASGKPRVG
jgi:hypothetical protein